MHIKHHNTTIRILLTTIIVAGFVSCSNYKALTQVAKPDVNTLVRTGSQNSADTLSLSVIPWKTYFPDQKLQLLIAEGLENGYNMKVALTRIQQADAALYMSRSALLPSVSASARVDHTRRSIGATGTDVFGYASNINTLGIAASWEADLWGKLSSQTKSKYAAYLNMLEYKKLIQTTLIASIAKGYYNLLAYDEQLRTTKETIILLTKSVETMQALKDAGQQTAAAVEQSKALLYNTQLSVFDLEAKSVSRKMPFLYSLVARRVPSIAV